MTQLMLTAWRSMPWLDPAGRFSPLKLTAFIVVCLPACWMGAEFFSGRWDFPSPYVGLIYHSGLWATYLLLASLMVTPARSILAWGRLAQLRRMLGVACFCYCALHVLAWWGLRFWDWAVILGELFGRPTLWIATVSMVVLFALAATSFDSIMRTMGPKRWRGLHRLVYGAALLAVLHFMMSPGSLQGIPFLMAGGYAWLMGWRLLDKRNLGTSPAALAALGLVAALLVLLLQPLWLATFQGSTQSPWSVLADNFNPDIWIYLGVPPVWVMLVWTCGTVLAVWLLHRRTLPQTISRHENAS